MPGAALTAPASVKPILVHLGLPTEPPPVAPVRDPALVGLNQTPTFDLTDPASVPEYEFYQTVSWQYSPLRLHL
jgi:hypothetical protein